MFCRLIPALSMHKDICELSDDGNPGAFNVFTHCGKKLGVICLLADVLKGFVPVFTATFFLDTGIYLFALVIAAPVLGHAVGMFNRFHGGKCIAASFGVMAGVIPVTCLGIILLAALYVFFSGIVRIKPNRICSIVVYALFLVTTAVLLSLSGYYSVALGCGFVSLTAIVKHLNIFAGAREEGLNEENCNDCR